MPSLRALFIDANWLGLKGFGAPSATLHRLDLRAVSGIFYSRPERPYRYQMSFSSNDADLKERLQQSVEKLEKAVKRLQYVTTALIIVVVFFAVLIL